MIVPYVDVYVLLNVIVGNSDYIVMSPNPSKLENRLVVSKKMA